MVRWCHLQTSVGVAATPLKSSISSRRAVPDMRLPNYPTYQLTLGQCGLTTSAFWREQIPTCWVCVGAAAQMHPGLSVSCVMLEYPPGWHLYSSAPLSHVLFIAGR